MDPNTPTTSTPQPEAQKSSKNTLLTLVSVLVLAGVLGLTLFLYIQNRITPNKTANNTTPKTTSETSPKQSQQGIEEPYTYANRTTIPTSVICYRFTSLREALMNIDAACILDLSGQNISSLPNEITKLTKLNEINLSNNKFTQLPPQLLTITTLISINLSTNQLTTTPDVSKLDKLQSLILTGNPIKDKITPTPGKTTTTLKIIY